MMEWLSGLNFVAWIGLALAALKAYKEVMKAVEESQQAFAAYMEVQAVFAEAWADKDIDNEEIKLIQDAMNKAIVLATGDWINFMNVGDTFHDKDTLQKAFADRSLAGIDIIFGDVVRKFPGFEVVKPSGALEDLWKGMQFCHQSAFFSSAYHKAHMQPAKPSPQVWRWQY